MSDGFDGARRLETDLMRPRAKRIYDALENAMHVQPELNIPYVIKGWLHHGALSVLYGAPNVGKSFLALDIANKVQNGEQWAGCRVSKSNVLYVAAESGAAFANRVAALPNRSFWLLQEALPMCGRESEAEPLAEALDRVSDERGPFGLIIFDTMARVMNGADENSGVDIGRLVAALGGLAKSTGAHVMLVHHVGKDASKGMRAHSSLLGAIDTEICVTKDEYLTITAKATKQRDMEVGRTFKYLLEPVSLGFDAEGDEVTACIVQPA